MQILFVLVICIIGLVFSAMMLSGYKKRADIKEYSELMRAIYSSALTLIKGEYKYSLMFLVMFFFLFLIIKDYKYAASFALGILLSLAAIFILVRIFTRSRIAILEASKETVGEEIDYAMISGKSSGLILTCLAILSLSGIYLFFGDVLYFLPFCFGVTLIALLRRIDNSIFTKGIFTDFEMKSVFDNVGNVNWLLTLSMEVFASYIVVLSIAAYLGEYLFNFEGLLSFMILCAGIISSLMAIIFVEKEENFEKALRNGVLFASFFNLIAMYVLIMKYTGDHLLFFAGSLGVLLNVFLFMVSTHKRTDKFFSSDKPYVFYITVLFLLLILSCLLLGFSDIYHGFYAVALCALGFLSILPFSLSCFYYAKIFRDVNPIHTKIGKKIELMNRLSLKSIVLAKSYKTFALLFSLVIALFCLFTLIFANTKELIVLFKNSIGMITGMAFCILFFMISYLFLKFSQKRIASDQHVLSDRAIHLAFDVFADKLLKFFSIVLILLYFLVYLFSIFFGISSLLWSFSLIAFFSIIFLSLFKFRRFENKIVKIRSSILLLVVNLLFFAMALIL